MKHTSDQAYAARISPTGAVAFPRARRKVFFSNVENFFSINTSEKSLVSTFNVDYINRTIRYGVTQVSKFSREKYPDFLEDALTNKSEMRRRKLKELIEVDFRRFPCGHSNRYRVEHNKIDLRRFQILITILKQVMFLKHYSHFGILPFHDDDFQQHSKKKSYFKYSDLVSHKIGGKNLSRSN